jgi:DNA-binding SARP family transcriptional activator
VGTGFGVLGRLEIRRSGELLRPLPPQQRTVLCVLLHHANAVVPDDLLAQVLWDRSPHGPRRQRLFQLLSRLREALGTSSEAGCIHRAAGG